jgi:hypothetical protein
MVLPLVGAVAAAASPSFRNKAKNFLLGDKPISPEEATLRNDALLQDEFKKLIGTQAGREQLERGRIDAMLADQSGTLGQMGGLAQQLQAQASGHGGAGTMAALALGVHLAWRAGRISAHDALIGRKLAWVLSGGDIPHATTTSEDALLEWAQVIAYLVVVATAATVAPRLGRRGDHVATSVVVGLGLVSRLSIGEEL